MKTLVRRLMVEVRRGSFLTTGHGTVTKDEYMDTEEAGFGGRGKEENTLGTNTSHSVIAKPN